MILLLSSKQYLDVEEKISKTELEAVVQMCFVKQVFLKISQNIQESTCARVLFLTKLQAKVEIVNGTGLFANINVSN